MRQVVFDDSPAEFPVPSVSVRDALLPFAMSHPGVNRATEVTFRGARYYLLCGISVRVHFPSRPRYCWQHRSLREDQRNSQNRRLDERRHGVAEQRCCIR